MDLFHQFYDGNSQVERSNRSKIVLIKKKEDSCTPMHIDISPSSTVQLNL
jgi:hypothetical protein